MVVVIHGGAVAPLCTTERIFNFLVVLRAGGPKAQRVTGVKRRGLQLDCSWLYCPQLPRDSPLTMPISSAALVPSSVRCCKKGLLRSDLDMNPAGCRRIVEWLRRIIRGRRGRGKSAHADIRQCKAANSMQRGKSLLFAGGEKPPQRWHRPTLTAVDAAWLGAVLIARFEKLDIVRARLAAAGVGAKLITGATGLREGVGELGR